MKLKIQTHKILVILLQHSVKYYINKLNNKCAFVFDAKIEIRKKAIRMAHNLRSKYKISNNPHIDEPGGEFSLSFLLAAIYCAHTDTL